LVRHWETFSLPRGQLDLGVLNNSVDTVATVKSVAPTHNKKMTSKSNVTSYQQTQTHQQHVRTWLRHSKANIAAVKPAGQLHPHLAQICCLADRQLHSTTQQLEGPCNRRTAAAAAAS
jgi:hypothetical protein